MIVFVLCAPHRGTHDIFERSRRFDFRIVSYNRLLRSRRLPRATYVFSDFDRLNFRELEMAGRVFRRLADAGVRALNDPARVRQRFALLRALHDRGYNRFDVGRVEDGQRPARLPVFLRTQSAHRGPLSDLLHDQDAVDRAIEGALLAGVPLRELMLVEYCAEPVATGLFRKLSVFRVGPAMVPSVSVHESSWNAKCGEQGIAGGELYDEELAIVEDNRFGDAIRPAFDIGQIDYGRADFGLVGGQPQVYEINTNPKVSLVVTHPFAARVQASQRSFERFEDALEGIDTVEPGAGVLLDDPELKVQRYHDRWMSFARWTP